MERAKTLLLTLLLTTLVLSLLSCGKNKDKDNDKNPESFTVSFNSDGGTPQDTQTVTANGYASEPSVPEKAGYTFAGWYLGDVRWDFGSMPITSDITLTAVWHELPNGSSGDTQSPGDGGEITPPESDKNGDTNGENGNTGGGNGENSGDGEEKFDGTICISTGLIGGGYSIFFTVEDVGEGITLADGNTYFSGDIKPVWAEIASQCNLSFVPPSQAFDVIIAPVSELRGMSDRLLPLDVYINSVPSLSEYFYKVGSTVSGAYYVPFEESKKTTVNNLIMMNVDMLSSLLDGSGNFTNDAFDDDDVCDWNPRYITPYIKKNNYEVKVIDSSGNIAYQSCRLLYSGSIISIMNNYAQAPKPVLLTNKLRSYIDNAYGGAYGDVRSDLFLGTNACWNVDELVALLRCAKANANLIFDGDFYGIVVDDEKKLDELSMLLFGCIDRTRIRALKDEGLIYVGKAEGVMYYGDNSDLGDGYRAVLPPVINGEKDGEYTRNIESVSEKREFGIAISAEAVADNYEKLGAALEFIGYLTSDECKSYLTYGTAALHASDGEKFDFYGEEIPKLSENTVTAVREHEDIGYEEYAKRYFGCAFDIYPSDGFVYQCMTDSEKKAYDIIRVMLLLNE